MKMSKCDSEPTKPWPIKQSTSRRTPVAGKFMLDMVDSDYPMIYISQSRCQNRRLWQDLAVDPIAMSAWDNRLLVQNAIEDQDKVEIYYQPATGGVTESWNPMPTPMI